MEEKPELTFLASTIDGTALAIHDYVKKRNIQDSRILLFLFHEFYSLLCIAMQTNSEEEFYARLDKILTSPTFN